MDPALGPPDGMAESDDLTPMIAQYVEVCSRYDDALVLFHVGDFYKTFGQAAETVARLCELTLVSREDRSGEYAMAGIPVENAESYIETLLDAGYRIAVAEQVEDPAEVSGVADRKVTRVITPGTLTEDALIPGDDNTFVASLARGPDGRGYGLAVLDVSTGDFYATGTDARPEIADEVGRFSPAEAIVGPAVDDHPFDPGCAVTPFEERAFALESARERVAAYFGPDVLASAAEVSACGALLAYAEYTRGAGERLSYLTHLTRYDPREFMLLDAVAVESLELFDRRSVRGQGDALVDVVDGTASALGARTLRDWLRRPLLDADEIEDRLDAVEEWVGAVRSREAVHDALRDVYDLERLISRVSRGRADARDLRSLRATLAVVPEIREAMAGLESTALSSLRADLDPLADVRDLIDRAIREDPPTELTEGGIVASGYSAELDDLRGTAREGKAWIERLEDRERERTGIESLSVGYNAVHGYAIEVTDANLDRVPDDYTRRQTLKHAERFVTPELAAREEEIVGAESRAAALEYDLFREVRDAVADETERVQALARTLARIDVLAGLAAVAAEHDYARPAIGDGGIEIRAGRHPVVERTEDGFVPNDARLGDGARVAVVTGPNMSGKSTYMRSVALIQVLAQIGSFVPAASATVPLVDRIFTRVGASDDIAGGRSTFMIEMSELAEILRDATPDSLVLLDEVGRGTSTADGLAIARAITEFVHDEVGTATLFATHHHELTATAAALENAVNLHFDVAAVQPADPDVDANGDAPAGDGTSAASEAAGGAVDVVFDHAVSPGPAEASYGIEVARMAGVPDPVVRRARELVAADDPGRPDDPGASTGASGGDDPSANGRHPPREGLAAAIEAIDLADTTPLEALNALADLKRRVERRSP